MFKLSGVKYPTEQDSQRLFAGGHVGRSLVAIASQTSASTQILLTVRGTLLALYLSFRLRYRHATNRLPADVRSESSPDSDMELNERPGRFPLELLGIFNFCSRTRGILVSVMAESTNGAR